MGQYWREFLRYYAGQSNRGQLRTGQGVEAAWVQSALLINNGTYLTKPVTDEDDLRSRCREAAADAVPHGLPWVFFLYEPLLPEGLLTEVEAVFASEGYQGIGGLRVMTADCRRLADPARPMPSVEMRRVDTGEDALAILDINMRAYDMPPGISESVMETNAYFANREREFAYVAYSAGVPVSCTAVLVLGDCLYVELVATVPEQQKKGYAEAVMRQALNESSRATGLHKTALDASAMGHPLYVQMGYRDGPGWRYYVKG